MLLPLVTLLAAIALLATGCRDPSLEDRYAEGVCSTFLLHGRELLDIYENVNDKRAAPGRDARVSLWSFALAGADTTWRLRRKLRALPVPDTAAGKEAAAYIRREARLADSLMAEELRRARRLPERITLVQSIRGLDRLELALGTAAITLRNYDIVEARVPELWGSFERSDSCKEVDALGQD